MSRRSNREAYPILQGLIDPPKRVTTREETPATRIFQHTKLCNPEWVLCFEYLDRSNAAVGLVHMTASQARIRTRGPRATRKNLIRNTGPYLVSFLGNPKIKDLESEPSARWTISVI